MFTGLVEAVGVVTATADDAAGRRISMDVGPIRAGMAIGDSVAINGCCLTVVELGDPGVAFQAGPETLNRTNLGELVVGSRCNLERALSAQGRLGGHIVQGHIDGTATIQSRVRDGEWEIVHFACPDLVPLLVPKGSVAVDGVSLTVCEVTADAFSVMLIPHTLDVTTLGALAVGARVNIETDILGKYVLKMLSNIMAGDPGEVLSRWVKREEPA